MIYRQINSNEIKYIPVIIDFGFSVQCSDQKLHSIDYTNLNDIFRVNLYNYVE